MVELQQALTDLPDLPLRNDPFCGEEIVDVAGVRAASTHAALLQVARRTWEAAQLRVCLIIGYPTVFRGLLNLKRWL